MRPGPVLATAVGAARGAHAAAAALACAGAGLQGAGLLIHLGGSVAPRPALLASAAARGLEERFAAHLPEVGVASRGSVCFVSLGSGEEGLERLPGALAIGRDSLCVLHVEPPLLRAALERSDGEARRALLRADLRQDRALLALACSDLIRRGLRVAVLKSELGWLGGRLALAGAVSAGGTLPQRLVKRLAQGAGA
jgi:hypothetical protein